MTTQNEAAERLRHLIERWVPPSVVNSMKAAADAALYVERDQALAAERRATVERIRHAILFARGSKGQPTQTMRVTDLLAILDEEAAR